MSKSLRAGISDFLFEVGAFTLRWDGPRYEAEVRCRLGLLAESAPVEEDASATQLEAAPASPSASVHVPMDLNAEWEAFRRSGGKK